MFTFFHFKLINTSLIFDDKIKYIHFTTIPTTYNILIYAVKLKTGPQ